MYTVVIKTSLLLVAIIAVIGAVQTRSFTELVVIFVAGGVIPGTNFVMPPELILLTVATALMMIAALVSRVYVKYRTIMRSLPSSRDSVADDPAYSVLVPGLAKVLAMGRALRMYIRKISPDLYLLLRRLGYTLIESIQVVSTKIHHWSSARINRAAIAFRRVSTRALAYVMRVTTF